MKRCKKCLTPDTRPDTAFVDGVCSACIAYEQRSEIDWDKHKEELLSLLDKHNGRCIVPSSGGKDSTWQVLTLKELGADVTIITAETCHLTPIGRRNIDNLSRFADTIEVIPNKQVRAKLNRMALELMGDISWPEHCLIYTVPFKFALDMDIPLVFYGENSTNQYGGPTPERQKEKRVTRQWAHEFAGYGGMRPQDFIGYEGISANDMRLYLGPTDEELEQANIEVYFLGQFLPWDSHANTTKALNHGFEMNLPSKANWWASENLDNAQCGLHDYFMYLKYGYGRACAQLSVDIRCGRITREQALKELKKRDGVFPEKYAGILLKDMLDNIGITALKFEKIIQDYTKDVA